MSLAPPLLTAWVDGIGVVGPGLADWPATAARLAGREPFEARQPVLTLPPVLPPAERRRTGVAVKVALICGHEACSRASWPADAMLSVFASSGGDGDNCHAICEALASDDRLISPTRFHNSVHNAPAGYWSIAMSARPASTSICAHDASFSAGLVEALTEVIVTRQPAILIAYDAPYPEPLLSVRPVSWPFGVAIVLSSEPGARSVGRIAVGLTEAAPTSMTDPALERLRSAVPTARALPLLQAIAEGAAREVVLDHLEPTRLKVAWTPTPAADGADGAGDTERMGSTSSANGTSGAREASSAGGTGESGSTGRP